MVTNAPIVPALAASRDALIRCRPGSIVGREDMRPASLRNATIEPVNVIPPAIDLSVCGDAKETGKLTDQNSQVRGHHVQGRNFRDMSKDAADASEYGSQTHHRMQGCNGLG